MIQCFRQTTRTSYDRNCRQLEARIGGFHAISDTDNSMDTNLIKRTKKYCDKRFLDCVINLIPDSGSKALWSLIPFFWALSPFLWALIPAIFWALSPGPIYHVTTLTWGMPSYYLLIHCIMKFQPWLWGLRSFNALSINKKKPLTLDRHIHVWCARFFLYIYTV